METLRDQNLHVLLEKLSPRVAENFFGLRVDQTDLALLVDNDHAIGSELQKTAELFFDSRALADFFLNDQPRGKNEEETQSAQKADGPFALGRAGLQVARPLQEQAVFFLFHSGEQHIDLLHELLSKTFAHRRSGSSQALLAANPNALGQKRKLCGDERLQTLQSALLFRIVTDKLAELVEIATQLAGAAVIGR